MHIIAYTYEADYHCIDCTRKRFSDGRIHGTESDKATLKPSTDPNGIWYEQLDSEGNFVHPLFSIDEWQEFDESYLSENPTQYLTCGDCHYVIDDYTHEREAVAEPLAGN